jgi:hypothetical protein
MESGKVRASSAPSGRAGRGGAPGFEKILQDFVTMASLQGKLKEVGTHNVDPLWLLITLSAMISSV